MQLRERSDSARIIPGRTPVCVRPAYYTVKRAFASHDIIKTLVGVHGRGKKYLVLTGFSFDFYLFILFF